MRQAIALGIDRQSLIKAVYGTIAPGLKPLNNLEYETRRERDPALREVELQPEARRSHC